MSDRPLSGAPAYFTDAAGVRSRELEGRMHDRGTVVANPPAACATIRVFRPEQGKRPLYYCACVSPLLI
ncbi:MAG: hypothetical protein DMD35_05125 [Gemmatimonadetes bacterium]|nr:MAG: hypothetical protein DMD35_05125 [Gemmatimonadota bacterium]